MADDHLGLFKALTMVERRTVGDRATAADPGVAHLQRGQRITGLEQKEGVTMFLQVGDQQELCGPEDSISDLFTDRAILVIAVDKLPQIAEKLLVSEQACSIFVSRALLHQVCFSCCRFE
ncbi:hypothetical protein [Catalinimonas alkaloidigena]|uniref:hypothetical protein n=1 Tax=Catalinimonas alkaloidigena TaxID=1075417 RepID=UPI00115FB2CE|nr:hypothetical protein [Catalinimonas alkaloidigena]